MGATPFQYDWLGNTQRTDDDAHGFYDRSLGSITNGTATAGPYRLQSATGTGTTRGGSLSTAYDPAGNLIGLSVTRAGPCLPAGGLCSQRFAYDWDPVGRLVQARRWDLAAPGSASSPLPTTTPTAQMRYAYDASDQRTLKTSLDAHLFAFYTGYIFDSLELRRASHANGDYLRTPTSEVAYLTAHGVRLARLQYTVPPAMPTESGSGLHVLMDMPDHLGSTSVTIDHDTGELVERGTYLATGQADSDDRPTRWDSFREDYRFTGKEEDVEVGLQYFGKRFLSPHLGRWVSADPLGIHGFQADPNGYAYVHGSLLRAIDLRGLDDATTTTNQPVQGGNLLEGGAPPPEQSQNGFVTYEYTAAGGAQERQQVEADLAAGAHKATEFASSAESVGEPVGLG